jgi:hypothetical protein
MGLYVHYNAGHLLVTGGILDQPAIYLAAMSAVGSFVSQANSEGK